MRFLTRIHEATSKDASRPVLTRVHVKDGNAYATDSYLAARVPVEGANGTDAQVPAAAVVEFFKGTRHIRKHTELEVDDREVRVRRPESGVFFRNDAFGTFPDIDKILDDNLAQIEGDKDAITVALDVEKLLRLAKALSADPKRLGVKLTVRRNGLRPIIVEPMEGPDGKAIGILMPVRIP